jgi:CHAT domain-containing protein/tetratricopeptide (TPR) repeat protein
MTSFDLNVILANFFALLDERRLTDCEALLLSARHKACAPVEFAWVDYLQAICLTEKAPPRWDQAERSLQHLLRAELPDPLLARVHLEIALIANYLGHYTRAIEHNRRSQRIFDRLNDREYLAKVLKNTGIAHTQAFERGQADQRVLGQALACHQRSLALCQDLGAERLAATVELELGTVYKAMNRWEEAIAQYTARAQKCRRFAWQRSLALTLDNLGEAYYHFGQQSQALTCYLEALAILAHLHPPDPYEEADVWANLALTLTAQGQMPAARVASDEAIRLVEIIRQPLQDQAARIGFFGTRVHIHEQRVFMDLIDGQVAQALTTLERAKSRVFLEMLAGRQTAQLTANATSEQTSFHAISALTATEIQARLPPDTLLLVYFMTPTAAYVLTVSDHHLEALPLPPDLHPFLSDNFEPDQQRLLGLGPDAQGKLHTPHLLHALFQRLLAPLADRLASWRRLCIVPYGGLHYIPFHALARSLNNTPVYLLGNAQAGREIVYAPSATVLLDYCQTKPPASSHAGIVFGVGNDLPNVKHECAAVARRLGGPLFIGSDATLATVLAEAPHYSIIHFACHGFFDPLDPLASGLNLADGRLTATMILDSLHLQANLVVLSGCQTGRNHLHRGDELIGLVRAFIYAGAPSVLVSLGPVNDLATRLLMENFYDHLVGGQSPASALRLAQIFLMTLPSTALWEQLRADGCSPAEIARTLEYLRYAANLSGLRPSDQEFLFAHPAYWAPFMLVGNRLET